MKRESEFVANLSEVFRLFGSIRSKRMFGGFGIYHQDLMIGLVADGELYLKADPQSTPAFLEAGCVPFEYIKRGVPMKMSYLSAPDAIFDDPELARIWAGRAYEAALRARRPSARRAK